MLREGWLLWWQEWRTPCTTYILNDVLSGDCVSVECVILQRQSVSILSLWKLQFVCDTLYKASYFWKWWNCVYHIWYFLVYRSPGWLSKKAQDRGQTTDARGLVAAHWWLWSTQNYAWQKDGKIIYLYYYEHQFYSTQHSKNIMHGEWYKNALLFGLSKKCIQPLTRHSKLDCLSENAVINLTLWKRNLQCGSYISLV